MLNSLTEAMERAIREMKAWPEQTIQVFHHNDSDGLSSGAILTRALERQGYKVQRFCLEKPYPKVLNMVYEQEGKILIFADFAGPQQSDNPAKDRLSCPGQADAQLLEQTQPPQ